MVEGMDGRGKKVTERCRGESGEGGMDKKVRGEKSADDTILRERKGERERGRSRITKYILPRNKIHPASKITRISRWT